MKRLLSNQALFKKAEKKPFFTFKGSESSFFPSSSTVNVIQRQEQEPVAEGETSEIRTPEEVSLLVNNTLRAIAQNESGGRAQAIPSRLRTSAQVPASYASSTQMVPAHAVAVLRGAGRGLSQESRRQRRDFAAEYGLEQADLRRAESIMHASQRIWDAIVLHQANIHELREEDMDLAGFTFEEYGRMMAFSLFRQLLLSSGERFHKIEAAVEGYLEDRADRLETSIEGLLQSLEIPSPSDNAVNPNPQPGTEEGPGQQALERLSDRRVRGVRAILDFSLPARWSSWNDQRKRRWLNRRLRSMRNQRRAIARVSRQAAEAFLAHELMADPGIQRIGLHESDVRAYIHEGRFNRFPEDRQAWNRIALQHAGLTGPGPDQYLDSAIAAAAESEGGWALSRLEFDTWIRGWISTHPQATDEQVVRAAAAHNGRSRDYPDTIWGHYQRIISDG